VTAFPTAAVAFAPALARSLIDHPGLTFVLRQAKGADGMRQVAAGEVDIALVDDWTGRLRDHAPPTLRFFHLCRDPLVLVVPPGHEMADPRRPVNLERLREERWMAAPPGEASREAVDRLLEDFGGAPPVPWEFEGLHTILSLVARGIGVAVVPALALAAGDQGVTTRKIPGIGPAREVCAVIRAASVGRPSVAATLRAVHSAAAGSAGGRREAGSAPSCRHLVAAAGLTGRLPVTGRGSRKGGGGDIGARRAARRHGPLRPGA
jgi:DNA-binding transcriptional LysR family regulator